jgi:hypothetical protein
LANRANRVNPDLPIIEEKADEMGTGMENIKISLKQPNSVKVVPEKAKDLTERTVERKLLYRPSH